MTERPVNTHARARRLAKALRKLQAGEKQPLANAAANMIDALLVRLDEQAGVINHLAVKRAEAEYGAPFGVGEPL
jgi:hypothetical protein